MAGTARHRLLYWLLYVPPAAALAFAAAELVIRVAGLAPPVQEQMGWLTEDPHIPYKPVPGSRLSGRSQTDEYDYDHRHNSLGFRDVEHAVEKAADTFRILGLGDSFTAGWGAAFEETYLHRLEVALNQRDGAHPRVEIIKAGINGYTAESEKLVLRHYGLRFDPDLVVIGFSPNDVLDTHRGLGAIKVSKQGYLTSAEAAELGEAGIWLYRHCHAARILLRAWVDARMQRQPDDWWMPIYRPTPEFEVAWRELEAQYDEILALTRAHGARLVVLHIPGSVPNEEFHAYPARRLGGWCAARGVLFVDPAERLREAARSAPLYWERDGHCTPEGYRVLAEALLDALVRAGAVR